MSVQPRARLEIGATRADRGAAPAPADTWTITAPPTTGSTSTDSSGSSLPDSAGALPTSGYARGIFSTSGADSSAIAGLGFRFGMASAYRENFDRANAAGLKLIAWLGGYSQTTCSFTWPVRSAPTRRRRCGSATRS